MSVNLFFIVVCFGLMLFQGYVYGLFIFVFVMFRFLWLILWLVCLVRQFVAIIEVFVVMKLGMKFSFIFM